MFLCSSFLRYSVPCLTMEAGLALGLVDCHMLLPSCAEPLYLKSPECLFRHLLALTWAPCRWMTLCPFCPRWTFWIATLICSSFNTGHFRTAPALASSSVYHRGFYPLVLSPQMQGWNVWVAYTVCRFFGPPEAVIGEKV